jgi:hypothetical protein
MVLCATLAAAQGAAPSMKAAAMAAGPNISVNADVRELAFVQRRASAGDVPVVSLWQARGRRLP